MSSDSLQDVLARLYSVDANERVKAANEIGEIGTPKEAPMVLKVVMNDEASTVRQMAIQSYYEILGNEALDDLIQISTDHSDIYVRIYAIACLGKSVSNSVDNSLKKLNSDTLHEAFNNLLHDTDEKIIVTTSRAIIQTNLPKLLPNLLIRLQDENNELIIRNILEAVAIWRYNKATDQIQSKWNTIKNHCSLELQTMFWFTLSVLGDKEAFHKINNENIDEFLRIKFENNIYRGREKLLNLIKLLKN